MEITFANAADETQKTQTTIHLSLVLTHATRTTEEDAAALVNAALVDFAKAHHLDIYVRDEKECAIGIDEGKLKVEVEEYFRRQFIAMITSRRAEEATLAAQAAVRQSLLGEE